MGSLHLLAFSPLSRQVKDSLPLPAVRYSLPDWLKSVPQSQLHLKASINRPLSVRHSPLSYAARFREGRELGQSDNGEMRKERKLKWVWEWSRAKKNRRCFGRKEAASLNSSLFSSLPHNQYHMWMCAVAQAELSIAAARAVGADVLTCNPSLCVGGLMSPTPCFVRLSNHTLSE